MKVIGLTGCICSGKSTVAGFLAEMGAVILDADKIGHEAFKPGTELWRKVVAEFGKEILGVDNNIDREKLGKIVFSKPEARLRLNRIMHPVMYEIARSQLEKYRREGVNIAVLEAPLLFEAGWKPLVNEVWVTVAPEPVIIKRLQERTGLSEEKSLARLRSQLSCDEQARQADMVIDTNCSLDELKSKMRKLWGNINDSKVSKI